jgi:hypothetical protein
MYVLLLLVVRRWQSGPRSKGDGERNFSWCRDNSTRISSWCSNPCRGKRLSYFPKRPYRLWGPRSLLLNGYQGSFPGEGGGVKRLELEVNQSPPSGAEVSNEWNYTPFFLSFLLSFFPSFFLSFFPSFLLSFFLSKNLIKVVLRRSNSLHLY